jgi:hypothetical protein
MRVWNIVLIDRRPYAGNFFSHIICKMTASRSRLLWKSQTGCRSGSILAALSTAELSVLVRSLALLSSLKKTVKETGIQMTLPPPGNGLGLLLSEAKCPMVDGERKINVGRIIDEIIVLLFST